MPFLQKNLTRILKASQEDETNVPFWFLNAKKLRGKPPKVELPLHQQLRDEPKWRGWLIPRWVDLKAIFTGDHEVLKDYLAVSHIWRDKDHPCKPEARSNGWCAAGGEQLATVCRYLEEREEIEYVWIE